MSLHQRAKLHVRLSASYWWFSWACMSSGKTSILGCDVLLTEQPLPVMREISSEFFIFQQDSPRAHRTCKAISLLEWEKPAFISPVSPDMWLRTVQIWTRLTRAFGEKCSSDSTSRKFKTSMNWSNVCYAWRMAWNKAWSMTQEMSGTNVISYQRRKFEHVVWLKSTHMLAFSFLKCEH